MLDFQVLVLKEVMNSLFEYVFLTNSYARFFICVFIPDHTILFINRSATVCALLKTWQNNLLMQFSKAYK